MTREATATTSPAQIYRAAWEKGDFVLCASMYKQFQDRLLGRPFIAENPEKANSPNTLEKDDRLQKAIRELLPAKPNTKRDVM